MLEVASTAWWHAFILIGVTSGLRKEEILNLTWPDVDLDEMTVSITAKKADEFTGADGQPYEMLAWSPKTYEARTVPIPDRTVESIIRLKDGSNGSPYLFVNFARLAHINGKMREGTWRGRAETLLRDSLEAQYRPIVQQLKEVAKLKTEIQSLRRRETIALTLYEEKPPLTLLGLVSQAARANGGRVYIQQMHYTRNDAEEANDTSDAAANTLALDGIGADNIAVATFVAELRDTQLFEHVELKSSGEVAPGGRSNRSFSLECIF